jgi:4'-phosphopantetheinyl transferase
VILPVPAQPEPSVSVFPAAPVTGQVHLHLVSLAIPPHELSRLQQFLSEQERQRANRLLDPVKRDRAVAGRGYLRELLGNYLGEHPGRVLLSEGEFGKLHLSEHLEPDALSFNLSHAGTYLLIAVCSGCEIGVDLELVREEIEFPAMARRYFSAVEQQALFGLHEEAQLAAFYRCWTRKEAYLKATGSGFSQPANGFDVSLSPDQPPALLSHHSRPGEVGRWTIRDIPLPAGYCAALAVEMKQPVLRMFPARQLSP